MPLAAETQEKIRLLLLFNRRLERQLRLLQRPLTVQQDKLVKSAVFADYRDLALLTSTRNASEMLEALKRRVESQIEV